jgi:hypothetical protein
MPSNGSGYAAKLLAEVPHLSKGEVADLRRDVNTALTPLAAMTVDEYTNAATPDAAGLKAATASSVAIQTYGASDLLAGGKAALLAHPRNLTFTTAGGTPADAPANVVVTGTDINDLPLTETVAVPQTATIVLGVKAFKTVTSIAYEAGQGAGATVSIGFGQKFGLSKKIKSRAGLAGAIREIAIGAVVTSGTVVDAATSAPNGTYSPSAAPNGTNDYAVYYEYDPA